MKRMTKEECKAFMIEGTRTGKIATVKADGSPHVVPIWFVMDGDDVIFTTWHATAKAANITRDGRVCIAVDDQQPMYSYVKYDGIAAIEDASTEERVKWATKIARRYMGDDLAESYGNRNGVDGEWLLRVKMSKIFGEQDLAE